MADRVALIVTGTRQDLRKADRETIRAALLSFVEERGGYPKVVIHGSCPTGVDAFVHSRFRAPMLRMPADWNRHGQAAGHESRWASSVGSGDVLGDEGRARGYWQQWGLEEGASLEEQASRALSLLRYHARRCREPGLTTAASVRAGVSGYATGGRLCRWVGAEKRVHTWRRYLARTGGANG